MSGLALNFSQSHRLRSFKPNPEDKLEKTLYAGPTVINARGQRIQADGFFILGCKRTESSCGKVVPAMCSREEPYPVRNDDMLISKQPIRWQASHSWNHNLVVYYRKKLFDISSSPYSLNWLKLPGRGPLVYCKHGTTTVLNCLHTR